MPFVRIFSDVLNYYVHRSPDYPEVLQKTEHPSRRVLLEKFADRESQIFLHRFYRKYRGKNLPDALGLLAPSLKQTPRALAAAYRVANPSGSIEDMRAFISLQLKRDTLGNSILEQLYASNASDAPQLPLRDRGHIAGVHPLELWIIGRLQSHPQSTWSELVHDSQEARVDVYRWLLEARNPSVQNSRIRLVIEEQAYAKIGTSWQRLGFPFKTLVPSLATALGSSGDRPSSLSELIGIIQAKGLRSENERVLTVHFAKGTPFETVLTKSGTPPVQLLSSEVSSAAKRALLNVVDEGTGRRVKESLKVPGCGIIPIGGKTGTGDNRYQLTSTTGDRLHSRVINRTATFVFSIGDKYFGTLTAYVPSDAAAAYGFTSALPVQILKIIAPRIMPYPLSFNECQLPFPPPAPFLRT